MRYLYDKLLDFYRNNTKVEGWKPTMKVGVNNYDRFIVSD